MLTRYTGNGLTTWGSRQTAHDYCWNVGLAVDWADRGGVEKLPMGLTP